MGEVVISLQDLIALPEYSCTVPTGVIIGKRWRCASGYTNPNTDWLIGEYVDTGDADTVAIKWLWAVSAPGVPHRGRFLKIGAV